MTTIKPGTGVGKLQFGLTRERVEQLLGAPSSKETLSHEEDGDETTEVWHYDTQELSLGFDEMEDYRLVTISVTGLEYTLNDKVVIGLSRTGISELMEELGETDIQLEMLADDELEDGLRVGSDLLSMNAWLEGGEVVEITCMPGLTEDDEWIWPAHDA